MIPPAAAGPFVRRHIGPRPVEVAAMLRALGLPGLDALATAAVPAAIRLPKPLSLPAPVSEFEALAELRALAAENQVFRSFIGMGYHDTVTPPVIQRNLLENPGWYTQYTPYQSEISQGRLEMLLNFQTMVCDLTGLEIANASLLDESTAAAEAMMLCHRVNAAGNRNTFLVADNCHPQTIEVVRTRARALGIGLVAGPPESLEFTAQTSGVLLQYPDTFGTIRDYAPLAEKARAAGALVVVAADLLALTLLKPPGEFGADVAVGSAQRFGVPPGFGGPHAAFFAARNAFNRQMPGRLVGVSRDSRGKPALRLSLGAREQHIRREKATSNICTAQALLANMAAAYAIYHGPEGLKAIAARIHAQTLKLAAGLEKLGYRTNAAACFDTLRVEPGPAAGADIAAVAVRHGVNLRVIDAGAVGVALDETVTDADLAVLLRIFNGGRAPEFSPPEHCATPVSAGFQPGVQPGARETVEAVSSLPASDPRLERANEIGLPAFAIRDSPFLQHPVFNRHHSETGMQRYLRRLESKDLSLCHSMIPLGSCTMKLNAASQMFPVSWPEFSKLHPFAPFEQTRGYREMFRQLEAWLAEITGFAAVSLQPNAGSQGEYAGLLVIRAFHESRGEGRRNVCLIPASAHGTNPASAVLAGMTVTPVACDADGNIDLADLRAKAAAHRDTLSCLMVTYPSTHGVFEAGIREVCAAVHEHGGQVYMDGANMNAQAGLTSPGFIGADVCHLNLHKTFCIPHGGGGPGMGPIGVAEHLVDFLPGHSVAGLGGGQSIGAVSAAPWGSASILPVSWMYIRAMGEAGLTEATKTAILNANYIAKRLENHFPTLYRANGLVAHECILDLRGFKSVTAEDVAKRLMDFGFHAPTLSWPVAGTLMVEPTESEPLAELDRFCDAMIAIHAEMQAVETGALDKTLNPLKQAPHTADMIAAADWNRPYSREQAAFPVAGLKDFKFWPACGRVDNVFGDRNLVCSCVGMDARAAAPVPGAVGAAAL